MNLGDDCQPDVFNHQTSVLGYAGNLGQIEAVFTNLFPE
jgi:hypothetical protein